MKVWVTGSGGLLGTAVCKALEAHGINYIGSRHIDADITDLNALNRFYEKNGPFTHLINCAAYTQVDLAEKNPEAAYLLNAVAPGLLGKMGKENHFRVLHLSTDYVFDGQAKRPCLETDLIAPHSVYGRTKAQGEARLLSLLPDACIVRTSWLFGRTGKHFVATMLGLMREKEEIRVVNDQFGRPTFAPDLAEVLIQALDWQGIYHAANSKETSWYSFAKAILAAAGKKMRCERIVPITSEEFAAIAPRPLYSVLNTQKLEQKIGCPMRPWKEALREYFL